MTAEHDRLGLSEIEILAQESTQHLRNIRAMGGDKNWAIEMGCFLVRATSILGWMGKPELVAQIYLDMEEDLHTVYSDPVLSKAFTMGVLVTGGLIGHEYKLNHPEKFSKKPEIRE